MVVNINIIGINIVELFVFGLFVGGCYGFFKLFIEYGVIIGLVFVRFDMIY